MGRAKIGIIVGGVLIASALGVYGCNHVHLVKKTDTATTQGVAPEKSGIEIQGTEPISENNSVSLQKDGLSTTTSVITDDVASAKGSEVDEAKTATTTAIPADIEPNVSASNSGESLTKIEIPELSYTEQSSVGTVVDKCAFLEGNGQVVFSVKVQLPVGVESVIVDYYCTYSTFSSLEINDELTVLYQSIENGRIAIISANRV